MEYFPTVLDTSESDELAQGISAGITENGWGFWAVENLASGEFTGFVGLNTCTDTPRGETVEIGWRLQRDAWGQGFATEGGTACLLFAFEVLNLGSVVAFTATTNLRSRAVMQRLGLTDTEENFQHPKVPGDSPLCEHVLYEIEAKQFATDMPVEIETWEPLNK